MHTVVTLNMPRRMRSYGRSRRAPNPIQSFKKVLNFAAASRAASTVINHVVSTGTDSVAAGQTSPTDSQVPTGSVIKYFEIQWSASNLVVVTAFLHMSIQLLRANQTALSPLVVGGNMQRNQVFYQEVLSMGQFQNVNRKWRFKVPKKFQRVREGDTWVFNTNGDVVYADVSQVIYKFYR